VSQAVADESCCTLPRGRIHEPAAVPTRRQTGGRKAPLPPARAPGRFLHVAVHTPNCPACCGLEQAPPTRGTRAACTVRFLLHVFDAAWHCSGSACCIHSCRRSCRVLDPFRNGSRRCQCLTIGRRVTIKTVDVIRRCQHRLHGRQPPRLPRHHRPASPHAPALLQQPPVPPPPPRQHLCRLSSTRPMPTGAHPGTASLPPSARRWSARRFLSWAPA
jgi:hypothetical protein